MFTIVILRIMDINKMKNENKIQFDLDYKDPIEISEFTKSLNAISNEYKKFIDDTYGAEQPVNAKLYVEKITEGSILTTLVEYSDFAIPFLVDVNTVYEFGKHLKEAFSYFSGQTKKGENLELDVQDLNNLKSIISPGTETGNKIEISVVGNNNLVVLKADDTESNAITNRISKELKDLRLPSSNIYKKQLFYFDQAKKDISSKKGNYGIIESLNDERLRVVFEDDKSIKNKMLKGKHNPLQVSYIVDVEVQTKRGKSITYKILNLHEIIDL